jgi:hypothetical protein
VHHRTLSGADLLPYLAKPTVGTWDPLVHRTLSGAHRTVRCSLLAVGSATRRARIKRPTVGSPDTVRCTLDSPVNYSRTPLISSREQQVRLSQSGAPDSPVHHRTVRCTQTVRCTTGQSGAPRQSWLWLNKAISSPIRFLLFPAIRHNICCFSEKEIVDRVRVTPVPNHACGCWSADLLRCVYRAASAPL